jgi:hypothetical protein
VKVKNSKNGKKENLEKWLKILVLWSASVNKAKRLKK